MADGSSLRTRGLNPYTATEKTIRAVLLEEIRPWLGGRKIDEVFFFGAGLGSEQRQGTMTDCLTACFPEARVRVETDLLAAAYACLGDRPGVVGILGTGSVAFCFDGREITTRRGGHGPLIGDDGAGPSLGRALIRALSDHELPRRIVAAHTAYYGLEIDALREQIYASSDPCRVLAEQVAFLAAHRDQPLIRAIIDTPILRFLERDLLPLADADDKIVLMGGIATEFAEILTELAADLGLEIRVQESRPIRALTEFLMKNKEPSSVEV